MHSNYDDLQYQRISELKPMYYYNILDQYYEPKLFDSALEINYEMYRINGDKDKELSLIDYLNTVRPNVAELITKKKVNERKNQLVISLMFLKYVYSDNLIIRPNDNSNEITTELYNSLLHRYQGALENKMEGSSFISDYIKFLNIRFNQVDLIRGSSYIKEDKWISNKKATINHKNNKDDDNYCFMYVLNQKEIGDHPERINKIIPFITKYYSNNINFPSQRKDWERFEKDNTDIALNILSVPRNKKKQ